MEQNSTINFRSSVFKALGDPTRLKILNFLRNGEKCVCEIVPHVGFTQPTVSRHLKVLVDCGILKFRKDGNKMMYDLSEKAILKVVDSIDPQLIESLSKTITSRIRRE